jgi:metallophosphoesterase (TIGR00282 family)
MKVFYTAEIVGKAGIYCFKRAIAELRVSRGIDFVMAGADGATGGNGIGFNHAAYLRKLGADVLLAGDCCFHRKDLAANLGKASSGTGAFVLRPANLPFGAPGYSYRCFTAANGKRIAAAVLLGQFGFNRMHADNPITCLDRLLERLRKEEPDAIVLDFHAVTSAEKRVFFAVADGRVSAVIGSHNRVQTADAEVLAGGTAVITDAGRTGSYYSVGGADVKSRIAEYMSGVPDWTKDAWDVCELQGVLLDIADNGKAVSIERVRVPVPVSDEVRLANA